MNGIIIRLERPDDYRAVERLTFEAFENFEAEGVPKREIPNEHFLVRLLREDPDFVPELDFVAERGGEIAGNIMYSKCAILRPDGSKTGALVFGPVSVKPEYQRQGIGTLLVKRSLDRAGELGCMGGKWKCCNAFDVLENDEAAFREFHRKFIAVEIS